MHQKQLTTHKAERDQLRSSHLSAMRSIREVRHKNRPTRLAAFLGKVSGISLIQKKLHQFQDVRKTKEYLVQLTEIKARQTQVQKLLELRFKHQSQEIDRKIKSLEKIDKRELAALARDQKREQRIQDRGNDGTMPSLADITGLSNRNENKAFNLPNAFEQAKQSEQKTAPDLMQAFERAVHSGDESRTDGEECSGLDKAKPPQFFTSEKPHKKQNKDKEL